jgi:bifunctional DNase/RNase
MRKAPAMIQVTVDSVRISLLTQNRVVVLRDADSRRYLPIWIGQFEAESISHVLQELVPSRPMTHDLLRTVFHELNATIQHVLINDIQDTTFLARIVVTTPSRNFDIDSRTSDAIALALRADVPIYVAPHVFEQASVPFDSDDQQSPPIIQSASSASSKPPTPNTDDVPASSDDDLSLFRDFINSLENDEDDNKNNPNK